MSYILEGSKIRENTITTEIPMMFPDLFFKDFTNFLDFSCLWEHWNIFSYNFLTCFLRMDNPQHCSIYEGVCFISYSDKEKVAQVWQPNHSTRLSAWFHLKLPRNLLCNVKLNNCTDLQTYPIILTGKIKCSFKCLQSLFIIQGIFVFQGHFFLYTRSS